MQNSEGKTTRLPLSEVTKFQVYEARTIALAGGDKVRITQGGTTEPQRQFVPVKGMVEKAHRLNNGAMYQIKGFTDDGDIIIKTGRHGKEQAVISKHYGNLAHGYVTTSHASQGITVDRVFIAQSSESFPASSTEQFYVSVSRGKESVKIYTDDKEELKNVIQKSGQRISATELQQQQKPENTREATNQKMAHLVNRLKSYAEAVKSISGYVADVARDMTEKYAKGFASALDKSRETVSNHEREISP